MADWAEHSAGDESGRTVFDSTEELSITPCHRVSRVGKKCRLRCTLLVFQKPEQDVVIAVVQQETCMT